MDDEALLLPVDNKISDTADSTSFWDEVKKLCRMSGTMILVALTQYLLRSLPIFMLGHVSNLSLSSASIATSISNVTGFSVIYGMAGALETLCGQAYGAKQYRKVGTYTFIGIICIFLVCIPISILWMYMDKLLILIGQDPEISMEARKYTMWLIPSLFAYAVYQALVRFLQVQSMILPMLLTTLAALCFHVPLLWFVIFKLNWGSSGAALAIGLSYWLNAILLAIYVMYSPSCKKTHMTSLTDVNVLQTMKQFMLLGIPAALMICLVWTSYEAVVLLSGLLPNPQIETSVVNICFITIIIHFNIPDALGASVSTQISNALGAGKPKTAKVAFYAVMVLSTMESVAASAILLACRRSLGYLFSNDMEVINYVNDISFLLSLGVIIDAFEATLSGIIRGIGWQNIAVYINFGAYYLVGTPIALLLGFVLHFKGKGLWCGLMAGGIMKALAFLVIMGCTDWEKQVIEAKKRIHT